MGAACVRRPGNWIILACVLQILPISPRPVCLARAPARPAGPPAGPPIAASAASCARELTHRAGGNGRGHELASLPARRSALFCSALLYAKRSPIKRRQGNRAARSNKQSVLASQSGSNTRTLEPSAAANRCAPSRPINQLRPALAYLGLAI